MIPGTFTSYIIQFSLFFCSRLVCFLHVPSLLYILFYLISSSFCSHFRPLIHSSNIDCVFAMCQALS